MPSLRTLLKNRKRNELNCKPEEKLSLLKPSNINIINCNKSVLDTPISPVTPIDNTTTLLDFGYKIIKTTDISQGQMIKVCSIKDEMQKFMIKKIDKKSFSFAQKTSNIIKETTVLRYCSDSKYICKYIDFFDDEKYYYLVTEYAGDITLDKWIQIAFEYVKNGKLKINEYRNQIKCILIQILQVIHWLHNDRNICHLGIKMENIVLLNAQFFHNKNNSISIPGNIEIKLRNFSMSTEFNKANEKNEMYSLSVLLFEMTFGKHPSDLALDAIKLNSLCFYIYVNNISHCATQNMLKIIYELFTFDGNKTVNLLNLINV
eukprot:410092_1